MVGATAGLLAVLIADIACDEVTQDGGSGYGMNDEAVIVYGAE